MLHRVIQSQMTRGVILLGCPLRACSPWQSCEQVRCTGVQSRQLGQVRQCGSAEQPSPVRSSAAVLCAPAIAFDFPIFQGSAGEHRSTYMQFSGPACRAVVRTVMCCVGQQANARV